MSSAICCILSFPSRNPRVAGGEVKDSIFGWIGVWMGVCNGWLCEWVGVWIGVCVHVDGYEWGGWVCEWCKVEKDVFFLLW